MEKILIDWYFCTDDDFGFRDDNKYDFGFDGHERYGGALEFENRWDAINFLEHMLTSFHVIPSHYYLIKDVYEIFDSLIKFVGDRNSCGRIEETMDGNYGGTEISVTIL